MRLNVSMIAFAVLICAGCTDDQTAEAPADVSSTGTKAPLPSSDSRLTGVDERVVNPEIQTSDGDRPAPPMTGLQPYQGRPYLAGTITLELKPDNTFVMSEIDGDRKVEGTYAYQGETLVFSDAEGDVGPARFPMQCQFEPAGTNFRLTDANGSCERFKALTFMPAAG